MRNLKRVLSLALATIMLLGMMVMGTSAANVSDFTDYDQITNQEAAAITAAIGIFDGYPDGSFGAVKEVDRATMATIICKIIYGADVNANPFKGSGRFTDLAGYEWAEGYINMCSTLGIVNGTGNNTFSPGATVTTWQAALMLQRALGWWNASDPATSTINELTVTSKAQELGLYGRLNLSINAPLTRNDVAELVLNTIAYNVPVEYSPTFNTYYMRGGNVLAGVPIVKGDSDAYKYTLGYANFDLVGRFDTDEFGRPGQQWGFGEYRYANSGETLQTIMREDITFAPNEPVVTYTSDMTGFRASAVTKALKDYVFEANSTKTASKTVDGVTLDPGTGFGKANITSASDIAALTGNGVIVEVYNGANTQQAREITHVVVIRPQVANVTSVNARNKTVTLSMNRGTDGIKAATYVVREDDPFYPVASGAKAGDILLGVYGENGLLDLWVPDSVTGIVNEVKLTNNIAGIDGVRYTISDRKTTDSTRNFNESQINNAATVYLDRNGYAMYVAPATIEAVSNYLYVTNVWQVKEIIRGIPTPTNYARGVNASGEVVTLKIANNIFENGARLATKDTNPTNASEVDDRNFPDVTYAYTQAPGKAYVFDNRAYSGVSGSNSINESKTGRRTDGAYTHIAHTSATAVGDWTTPSTAETIITTVAGSEEGFFAEYQQGAVDSDLYLLKVPAVGSISSAGVMASQTDGIQSFERTLGGVYMSTDVKFVSATYNADTDRLTASANTGVQFVKSGLTYVPVVTQDSAGHRLITTVYILNGSSYTADLYYVSGKASYRVGYTDASGRPAKGYNNGLYLNGAAVDSIAVTANKEAGFYQKVGMDGDAYILEEFADYNKVEDLIVDAYNRSILVGGSWYDVSNAVWTDLTKNNIDSIDSIRAMMETGTKLYASFTYDAGSEQKISCLYITEGNDTMPGSIISTGSTWTAANACAQQVVAPADKVDTVIALSGKVTVGNLPTSGNNSTSDGTFNASHFEGLEGKDYFVLGVEIPGSDNTTPYALRITSAANDPKNWASGTYPWGSEQWDSDGDGTADTAGTNDRTLFEGVKRVVNTKLRDNPNNAIGVLALADTVVKVEVMLKTELTSGAYNTQATADAFDDKFVPTYTITIDCTGVEPVVYTGP